MSTTEIAKRTAVESLSDSVSKSKKRHKKKHAKRTKETPVESELEDRPVFDLTAETKLRIPSLKNKLGQIRELGDVCSVPCYECIRTISNDSFAKYPSRCWDVKHETRIGMNGQCSTCAR